MAARKGKAKAAQPRRAAAAPAAEIVEELDGGGMTLDSGIVYATTVALAAALTLMIMAYQTYAA